MEADTERAMRDVIQTIAALTEQGYIFEGDLTCIYPKQPGPVVPVADLHLSPITRVVIRVEKAPPAEVSANLLPDLLPVPNVEKKAVELPLDNWTPLSFQLPDGIVDANTLMRAAQSNPAITDDYKKKLEDCLSPEFVSQYVPPAPDAQAMGYTGNVCTCGSHRMVRRGTCECCEDCGSTSGCS